MGLLCSKLTAGPPASAEASVGREEDEGVRVARDDTGRWQLRYSDKARQGNVSVDEASIIGCVKVASDAPSPAYSVLFVETSAPAEDGKEAMPTFQSVVARSLPADFLAAYKIEVDELVAQQRATSNEGPPSVHIIVSRLSGTGLAEGFYQDTVRHVVAHLGLREHVDYEVHFTESPLTVVELTRRIFLPRAKEGKQQRIILLSGDGGIVDVINVLLSEERGGKYRAPSLAVLPLGTGNALAHSAGITQDNTLGLATLARGLPKALPLFSAKFSPGARLLVDEGNKEELLDKASDGLPVMHGAVVFSWGMHAGLVGDSDTAEYRKYGVERFQMAAKEALYPSDGSAPHRYRAHVSWLRRGEGGEEGSESWQPIRRTEHMYVLATLVSNLEKTFTISPASRPLDGHLRLVHFGPMSGDEVMRVMGLAYQGGTHVNEKEVGYEDIEGLRIEFVGMEEEGRWRRVCVDGKIVRVERDGWVEVRREESKVVEVLCLRRGGGGEEGG